MSKQWLQHVAGLRGLAIFLVVLYHALPGICPNGFLGVDVFFVISGYFLVGRQLEAGAGFNVLEYAGRKAARLLTPYLALILLALVGSLLVFAGTELAGSIPLEKACLLGTGNVYLDANSGSYFSASTRNYPLMHLWYMGVLLQAYAVFGLLFWIWERVHAGKRARVATLCIICACSLIAAHLQIIPAWRAVHGGCYYWTCTRLWEFAIGGLLVLLPPAKAGGRAAAVVALSCAFLVLLSFLPLRNGFLYNGAGALLGSAVVWAGRGCPGNRLLENRALLWLGGISFALYLVHWPLICYAEYILRGPLQPMQALVLAAFMLPCAYVFFRCVERPRFGLWVPVLLYALCIGLHVKVGKLSHSGRLNAVPVQGETIARLDEVPQGSPYYDGTAGIAPNQWSQGEPPGPLLQVIGDGTREADFAVIGDSHAFDLAAGLDAIAGRNGWHGIFLNSYVVPFWGYSFGTRGGREAPGNFCDEEKQRAVLAWLKRQPSIKRVLLTQYWRCRMTPHTKWNGEHSPGTLEGIVEWRARELGDFCRRIQECGKEVLVLTDMPEIPAASPFRVLRASRFHHLDETCIPSLCCSRQDYERTDALFNACLDALQEAGACRVFHREHRFLKSGCYNSMSNGTLMNRDSHHLTQEGAAMSLEGLPMD